VEGLGLLLRAMAGAAPPEEIIGIGVDFTSSTVMPALADGTPLCLLQEFKTEPHAWPKLWKHHAAQAYADRINATAAQPGGAFRAVRRATSSEGCGEGLAGTAEALAWRKAAARWIEGGD
jgi:L-ribulokinase